MKKFITLAILSLSCLILLAACSDSDKRSTEATSTKNTKLDQKFDFELVDVAGKKHQLADYSGKPLVVKYWASWCPICLAGLDEIESLSKDKTKDYQLITIVSPNYKNEKKSADFVEWFKTLELKNMTVLLDEDGELSQKLGVRVYPSYAYYDSSGVMLKVVPGYADQKVIEKTIAEI